MATKSEFTFIELVLICPLCGKVYNHLGSDWLTQRNSDGGEFGPVCRDCANLETDEMLRLARTRLSGLLYEVADLWALLEQLLDEKNAGDQ